MVINVQEILITKVCNKGSNAIVFNIDRNGVPFGQIYTFRAKGEIHPYTAKPLVGDVRNFVGYAGAERYMRGLM